MTPRVQVLLWAAQRFSAAVLGLCVVVHIGTIIYAVRQGVSAAEILDRTQGSLAWTVFYSLFAIAVALHVPLGLRVILVEWLGWRGWPAGMASAAFGIVLLIAGFLAIAGVLA